MQFTPSNLKKVEEFLKEVGYELRYEKGNFNSGYCVLQDKNIVVVNKYFNPESRFQKILEIIPTLQLNISNINQEQTKKTWEKLQRLFVHELNFEN
jgi:hypothetical protein